jgi:hypothetical protein
MNTYSIQFTRNIWDIPTAQQVLFTTNKGYRFQFERLAFIQNTIQNIFNNDIYWLTRPELLAILKTFSTKKQKEDFLSQLEMLGSWDNEVSSFYTETTTEMSLDFVISNERCQFKNKIEYPHLKRTFVEGEPRFYPLGSMKDIYESQSVQQWVALMLSYLKIQDPSFDYMILDPISVSTIIFPDTNPSPC